MRYGLLCCTIVRLGWIAHAVRCWADYASVLGVVVSVTGFAITIASVMRSKRAVSDVRNRLALQSVVTDLNRVVADVEDLKQLHRYGAWAIMPARYTAVRRQLQAVKVDYPNLSKAQRSVIQGIIQQFTTIEQLVEASLARKEPPGDPAALNGIVAEQSDKLNAILVFVQRDIGAKP